MSFAICAGCHRGFFRPGGRGRPRKFCDHCRPAKARVKRPRLPIAMVCPECSGWFEAANGNVVCCSQACRTARKRRLEDLVKRLERWRRHERTRPTRNRSKRGA